MSVLAINFLSQTTLLFVLLGLATGALYGVVALGIVLVYRASGVLNFAAGSLGAVSAFLFYSLRDTHGVPWVAALILALLLGAAIGALTQVLVMGVLRHASLLSKLIATLGLMALGQGLITVVWGVPVSTQLPTSIFPTDLLRISSGIAITADRLILVGLVIVLAIAARVVYSKTLFGLATGAVAENRRVAAASGWSPSMIELVNFSLAGVLSALAAILLAPIIGLSASILTLSILPALAAALVGRFSSFTITVGAAFGIGILGDELGLFQTNIAHVFGTSELQGLPDVAPLLIIVVVTALSGRARIQRGEPLTRLPLPGSGILRPGLLTASLAVGTVLSLTLSPVWTDSLGLTFGVAIVVLSVVAVSGYGGQLSLAQYAFAGFGAWIAARLVATEGISFEAALVLGVIGTIPLGLIVALPALRTRGVNLAVATLALASMIYSVIFNNGALTGGFSGTVVTTPTFAGIDLDPIRYPDRYAVFTLCALTVAGLAVANVRRGRAGRRMLAVRANERAAASIGVGVYSAKLYAFALGSAIAALGGILLGFRTPNVQFVNFDVFGSINVVLYAVIGGLGWAAGAIIGGLNASGALPSVLINKLLGGVTNLASWLLIVSGVGVVLVLRVATDGLVALHAGQMHALRQRFRQRPRRTRAPEPRRVRPPATLEVTGVSVRFGGVVALDDVSFSVSPGTIVGLIGPNGAGKTTLLDVITGFTKQSVGSVCLGAQQVDNWSPERRARAGVGRSWQAVELFEEMTVCENLLVAADRKRMGRYVTDLVWPGPPTPSESMLEVIEQFGLGPYLDDRPSKLSQGLSRLVGIGRAVVTDPAVLLLDEPAAGLDAEESTALGIEIRALVERTGIGVLIIEHDVNLLLNICDHIVVLDFGRKIAEGKPADIQSDPAVVRAYLGDEDSTAEPRGESAAQHPSPAAGA